MMKKIGLLLTCCLLMGISAMAQKIANSPEGPAPGLKAYSRNAANAVVHNPYAPKPIPLNQSKLVTTESFEGTFPPAGWTKQNPDGGTGWDQCADGTTPLDGWNGGTQTVPLGGGGYVAYCTWTTGGSAFNDQWLISPQYTVMPSDSLTFYLWFFGAYLDTLEIRVSTTTNLPAAFTTVLDVIDTTDLTPMESWHKFSYPLAAFAGQNIYVAFREKVPDNFNEGAYLALDLVSLGSNITYANDIAPTALISPASNVVLTAADTVIVTVYNLDTLAHGMIPVSYVVDGGLPVHDTIVAPIPAGGSVNFKFAQLHNFSIPGHVYDIMIYTSFPGDAMTANDTLLATVTNYWDVAPVSFDEAPIIAPGSITPKATVINNGTLTTTFDVTMNISGGYTSTKTITGLAPGLSQQVVFDPWNATNGSYGVTVFTILAADSLHSNDTIYDSIFVMDLKKIYCYVAYDPSSSLPEGPAFTYIQAPDDITSLADQSANQFVSGGTWGYGNKWYGSVYGDNTLITLDTLTGARTVVGPMGVGITGLAYDYSTNTMYGMAWDGANSVLYTVNIVNGAVTLVGTSTSELLINLACDLNGNLFAVAITDDNLYSINSSTGAGTVVGAVGFDAAYAQDMEFDLNSGILYMAAYNGTSGAGELRTVNTSTGATTLLGDFEGGSEITGLAIPYTTVLPANDAAAVSINGLSSSCALGSAEPIEVTITNMGTAPIASLSATVAIDGGTPVTETVTASIGPGVMYDYTFTATADLSAPGIHTIVVWVTLTGDTLAWNDTTTLSVTQVAPANVPFTMGFEPTDSFEGWAIENTNADNRTWYYATTGGNTAPGVAEYTYSATTAANDWLISTCLHFETGVDYRLTFYYKVASGTYPENLKVNIGTNNVSTALTTNLTTLANIGSTSYTMETVDFTVPATGTYYIGWHCYSAADMWNLFVDDINIMDVTGVNENTNNAGIVSVYPNPVKNVLHIETSSGLKRVTVTNMIGELVYESLMNGLQTAVNTSSLVDGMYFITVETEEGVTTKKFIVE